MALNFPNSPTDGQIYTDTATGYRWVWDSGNTTWKSTSTYAQTITVSSTQPGSPVIGQLWWNKDYGRLFVYYSDGDSSQWVDASPNDFNAVAAFRHANAAYNSSNADYVMSNAAFALANTALQNTSGTFAGNLSVTGNVGIGSVVGSNRLLISTPLTGTTIRSNPALRIQSEATGRDICVQFSDNVTNSAEVGMLAGNVYFTSNGTERMRISNAGRVGINTSIPASNLQVVGDSTSFTGLAPTALSIESQAVIGRFSELGFTVGGEYYNRPLAKIAMEYTGSGSFIHLGTSNSYASGITNRSLTVDFNGRITTPFQPVFGAFGNGTQSWSGGAAYQVLQLNSLVTSNNSRNSNYSTSTYRFTAPIAGMYMFFGKITATGAFTGPQMYLFINGGAVGHELAIGYSVAYMSTSGMIPWYMNAGDFADLRVVNNNNVSMTLDLGRCHFIGWLLG